MLEPEHRRLGLGLSLGVHCGTEAFSAAMWHAAAQGELDSIRTSVHHDMAD